MDIIQKLLEKNMFSRPMLHIRDVNKIVVHYVANPNTSAIANRNYFNNINVRYASSHFIVGLDGEIIQCIPLNEIAYHGNGENYNSIGVEFCHPDKSGKPNDKTYKSLLRLLDYLCNQYQLNPKKDIIRHHDCRGSNKKCCPKYYVENVEQWEQLKNDVFFFNKPIIDLTFEVENINQHGYVLSDEWKNTQTMLLKNVPYLLARLGGINLLVENGVISNRELWERGKYNYAHVSNLLIKFSNYISKLNT